MLRIYAPASSANISVGFDTLGVAVSPIDGSLLGDVVQIEELDPATGESFAFATRGDFVHKLPTDLESNLVYKAYVLFKEYLVKQGQATKPLKLTLEKNMPIGSGLGSSSCSTVAALVALNQFHGNPFNSDQLLRMMGELEGSVSGSIHYDNVAPCYLGGVQLMVETETAVCEKLPFFDQWYWVLAYPGIQVSTAEARRILPDSYTRAEIIAHGRQLGCFVHACHTQQPELAASMMKDVIAEPYREALLPNYPAVKAGLLANGALAAGISGSGPTMYAIAPTLAVAQQLEELFREQYLQNELGFVKICKVDNAGAREI